MTLRTRLILIIGAVALLLVLPALYAAQQLSHLRDIAQGISHTHGAAYVAMGRFQAHLRDADRFARSYLALRDAAVAGRRDAALDNAQLHLERLQQTGYGEAARPAGDQLERIDTDLRRIDSLVVDGRDDEAIAAFEEVRPAFALADSALQQIGIEIDRRSREDLDEAGRISAAALTTTLLALVACFFIAVLLGSWATYTLVQPINRLRRSMAAVSAGEFVVPEQLPYERTDELGDLARSFRSMTQQLTDLDRMKADFMSIATHELKTPINVISGYSELIEERVYGDVNDQQLLALKSIQEQSRILTQLVNQLLDISRLEAGGLKLEIQEIELARLMERLQRTFSVLARKQEIDFTTTIDPSAPQTLPGDGDRLRDQVLGNLLANALKFTPRGGSIRVNASGDDEHVVIEVSDTGSGMPADQLPHVFDKYFQIGEQARSKGAGLGLTIAHDIVEAHGGTITVESEEGRGTTFCIRLPYEPVQEPART